MSVVTNKLYFNICEIQRYLIDHCGQQLLDFLFIFLFFLQVASSPLLKSSTRKNEMPFFFLQINIIKV